jgi:hypothetical protein
MDIRHTADVTGQTAASVIVATMTLARDADEERLIERALVRLSATARRIAVTDGGSSAAFVDVMRRVPGVEVTTSRDVPGLIGQVRTSLRTARTWGDPILYTEPDKYDFFDRHLGGYLDRAWAGNGADIVLSSRSAQSFATYPASQQEAETVLNDLCGDLIGLRADYLYGPFVMRAALVDALEPLPPAIGWGWRPYLFVRAHRMGGRIASVEGDFDCPAEQREDGPAEQAHRLKQLAQNLRGVALAL